MIEETAEIDDPRDGFFACLCGSSGFFIGTVRILVISWSAIVWDAGTAFTLLEHLGQLGKSIDKSGKSQNTHLSWSDPFRLDSGDPWMDEFGVSRDLGDLFDSWSRGGGRGFAGFVVPLYLGLGDVVGSTTGAAVRGDPKLSFSVSFPSFFENSACEGENIGATGGGGFWILAGDMRVSLRFLRGFDGDERGEDANDFSNEDVRLSSDSAPKSPLAFTWNFLVESPTLLMLLERRLEAI
ncbi:hypothetical protein OGAPHI_002720 [Ogataea philodendri]|uniref:Uncharacterized protein n=1 Tax=Ogataea philodendri TaxID=1378263 RepID=A0A9P8PCB0_9ASCO|nr:uncharacterized protein OGAPHI_002720 [Ogataea philodendri]KAH3668965.1 hypothetical protein OGAPHI_002720 [Ogataea philodendri]